MAPWPTCYLTYQANRRPAAARSAADGASVLTAGLGRIALGILIRCRVSRLANIGIGFAMPCKRSIWFVILPIASCPAH